MAKKVSMRDKMKGKLKERTKESHKSRDQRSGGTTYLDKDKMGDINTWWATKGDHIMDVIPYFAGEKDPRNDVDEPTYVLDIFVHKNIGPMDDMFVCLAQYGEPCPACEELKRRYKDEDLDYKKDIKPLKPSRRCVYNVIIRDDGKEEKKGIQILEIAHFFMEKHLAKIAKDPRGGGFTVFSDPDEGKSISFERTGTGATDTGYTGHQFLNRPSPISDEELEAAYCLDDLIEMHSYEQIYEALHAVAQAPPGEEEEQEEEVDAEEVDQEEAGENTLDDSGTEQEEVEEEVKDKKKDKASVTKKRERRPTKAAKCPHGGVIGDDIDELDECDDCAIYNACADIADGKV